jgi:LysR family hydrogen peroxide-inducible transcriptional activator
VTLAQLTYLVAVDTHRHFVRAAEACGVTQPTLSMQLLKLERELGVRIFDRSKQPVEPTDLGRQLVDQARRILQEAARMRELVAESRGEVAGELRLGVIPTLAPYLLPRFVTSFISRHPAASLVVEELRTEELVEQLRAGLLDAGLVASSVEERGLIEDPLFEEPFVAYVSERHPLFDAPRIRAEELSLSDLWLLHEGHCFRDQVVRLCSEVIPRGGGIGGGGAGGRPLHFESGNLETLKRLVESSGGITLLPYLAVADLGERERARVRPFVPPAPSRWVRLVRGKAYLKRALVEALTAELLQAAGEAGVLTPPAPPGTPGR